jgi:hypothetical protein
MNHFRYSLIVVSGLFIISESFGQAKIRKLPTNINQPSINLYAPALSGDGESLIYLSDYTDDGHHSMYYATKKSVSSWNDPVEVTKLLNRPTMNYRGGYCLSFDGDVLMYTSRKSGLGGFELWYSTKEGNNWSAPKNFGSPINSAGNEGTPSISPDGEYLYYMRCDQMAEYKGASGCKLMVAKRKYNSWEEPVELPSNINTGNSQNPKILADGETLIFSSDQFGGKGGLDLYMTKKRGDSWSEPVPMEFMNSESDDQFISIPAKGRYLYTSQKDARNFEIVQVLIPEEFQPKKVMRVKGIVTDKISGEPVNANLSVFNVGARDRIWNGKIGDKGEFTLVLNEGNVYDLSINHEDASYMYYSKIYSLEEIGPRDKDLLKIELAPLEAGTEFESDILFKEYSAKLNDNTVFELRRLADMTRKNPSMQIEINVLQNNYLADSIQSALDLTEVIIDSIYFERQVAIVNDFSNEDSEYEIIDSLDVASTGEDIDSLYYKPIRTDSVRYETIRELKIKRTYHNDRTIQQGESIKGYLVERGAKPENIIIVGSKKAAELTERADSDTKNIVVRIKVKRL